MRSFLIIIAILAAPAYGHDLAYWNPTFLKLSGGDPVKAQELDYYCSRSGMDTIGCANSLAGSGNLKGEAARKCAQESTSFQSPLLANGEVDPRRAHKIEGRTWHSNYISGGDTGRLHRHFYTKSDEQRAYESKKRELYADYERATRILRDEVTKTSEGNVSGKGSVGLPGVGSAEVGGGGKNVTTTEFAILTERDRQAIEKQAEEARKFPSSAGVEPTGLCFAGEKICDDGDGHQSPNSSYELNVEAKEKENEKKNGKKTSSNDDRTPPKHEDDHTNDIPDDINSSSGESWAGIDGDGEPNTAWATPVMDPESLPATAMEKCLEAETKRLEREIGTTTRAESDARSDREKKAADLLKNGYCSEAIYGRDYCAAFKFKQDSVVAVDLKLERQEAYNSAMDRFKKTRQCDPSALGSDFCKSIQDGWRVNPILTDEGLDSGLPSLILKKPIKTATIPKVMQ